MNDLKDRIRLVRMDGGEGRSVEEIHALADLMLLNIGSIDGELRDELIYWTLDKLIRTRKIDTDKLKAILEVLTGSDYLFYRIGRTEDDSVFTRSFSALIIGSIIQLDVQDHFLTGMQLQHVLNCATSYLEAEKDTRGYVADKGWAHSISHGANLLEALVKHPGFSGQDLNSVLIALKGCLFKGGVYTDDEDYSMIRVINGAVKEEAQYNELAEWIISVADKLRQLEAGEGQSLTFYRVQTNIMNFLKSLYFALETVHYPETELRLIKAEIIKLTKAFH